MSERPSKSRGATGLLGAHIGRCADRQPGLGQLVAATRAERPGDPEVGHQRVPSREEDVFRLDVAVDDAVLVRVVERVRRLAGDAERVVQGQLRFPIQPVPKTSLPRRTAW